jgi:hypothetical protein
VYSWEIQSSIAQELKVTKYIYDDEKREFPEQEYLTYSVENQNTLYPLDVSGYDNILQITPEFDKAYVNTTKYPYISYNSKENILYFHRSENEMIKTPFYYRGKTS